MTIGMTAYADAIVETIAQALLVLDGDLRVLRANKAFCRQFEVSPETTEGQLVHDLGNGQWNIASLRRVPSRWP